MATAQACVERLASASLSSSSPTLADVVPDADANPRLEIESVENRRECALHATQPGTTQAQVGPPIAGWRRTEPRERSARVPVVSGPLEKHGANLDA